LQHNRIDAIGLTILTCLHNVHIKHHDQKEEKKKFNSYNFKTRKIKKLQIGEEKAHAMTERGGADRGHGPPSTLKRKKIIKKNKGKTKKIKLRYFVL
jgi:hypothetical protein